MFLLQLPLASLFCALVLLPNALGLGPVTDLHIVNKIVAPDGFSRSAVVAEGGLPGPPILGKVGSRFQINVINQLQDNTMLRSTSIHWHGIFQNMSPWSDGPAFVTQCPIAANHSFLYDFTVTRQTGTYWYHSHLSNQYCDGLRGPFIIYDPNDPVKAMYDIDDATTIISLMDWYHVPSPQEGRTPNQTPAASTLINGVGRYVGGPQTDLAVVNVQPGKRHRFRIINMSCEPDFVFSIDGHNFTVIEADGVLHQPLVVDSLEIFAGQRYSIVLEANQTVGNYWIRANPSVGSTGFNGGINSAILRYNGAAVAEPTTTQTPSVKPLVEANLHPLAKVLVPGSPVLGGADIVMNLLLAFDFANKNYQINGATFVPPSVPVLLQILSGAQRAQDLLPAGSVYPLTRGKVVELSIPSGVLGGHHPFHLHGHNFHVVRSADSHTYNFVNPPIRDVVNIGGSGDNVTIRFVTDNPGPWMLHCHIDWHLSAGLAIVFAEDIKGEVALNSSVPDSWRQLCPTYNSLDPSQL